MSNVLKRDLAGDYRLLLSWRYNQVEMLGLPSLKETRPLRLDYLYVPPRFSWEHRGKETFWLPKALSEHKHLVVLGDPGAGKSTLVKSITYSFGKAGETALSRTFGKLLPIPIILRDYRVSQWQNYSDMLSDFIKQLDEKIRDDISVEWLLEFLRMGEAILLFDGIDEIGKAEARRHLRDKVVVPFIGKFPQSHFILTSRIIGYEEVPFDGISIMHNSEQALTADKRRRQRRSPSLAGPLSLTTSTQLTTITRCYIAPFNNEDFEQFIVRWYALREEDEDKRREGIESLKRAIHANDRVKRLAGNPQLLTLMALIHRNLSVLPSGRVKLYDKIIEAYLETIQTYRQLGQYPASLDQMKRWLARVGWEMQNRRRDQRQSGGKEDTDLLVHQDVVLSWLTEAIAEERENAEEEAREFLDYVARRSGLLIPRGFDEAGTDLFGFIHLTFQEYFAAVEIAGRAWDFNWLFEQCAKHLEDQHWHETLHVLFELLAAQRGLGDKLVEALMRKAKTNAKLRQGATQFFPALLLDNQNGLSQSKQAEVIRFTMETLCREIDEQVITNLKELPEASFNQWVAEPMKQRLREISPAKWPRDFLLVGDDLITDWPQVLKEAVIMHSNARWPDTQTAVATLISAGVNEVVEWAGSSLPIHLWLAPIFDLFGVAQTVKINGRDIHIDGISIAEITLTQIFNSAFLSHQHLLLAQSALSLAASRSQILRAKFLPRHLSQPLKSKLYGHLAGYLAQSLNRHEDLAFALALARSLARALTRHLDLVLARSLAFGSSLPQNLAVASSSPRLAFASETKVPPNPLLLETAAAEWLAFQPNFEHERVETIGRLQKFLLAKDDWTKLMAINNLITLNAGTRALANERNHLCNIALHQPNKFSFPAELREATEKIALINLPNVDEYGDGNPFLKPEWFDPKNEESKFFLSPPGEFFALAAEVLDPKGETELAKWRK